MSDDPDKLEQLVSGLIRNLPPRQAPVSLQARVLAQVSSPWWRRGFVHWPLTVRGLFLAVSVLVAGLAVKAVTLLTDVLAALLDFILNTVPPWWLYGAAAVGCLSYIMLFGLGAVAYRALQVQR